MLTYLFSYLLTTGALQGVDSHMHMQTAINNAGMRVPQYHPQIVETRFYPDILDGHMSLTRNSRNANVKANISFRSLVCLDYKRI